MSEIEKYLEKRDKVLMSGSADEMRKLLKEQGFDNADTVSDNVLLIALHKDRVHWRECPPELLKESVWWLLDREYDLMM